MGNAEKSVKQIVVSVGGDAVDFTHYPPITQGDKKRVQRELSIDFSKIRDITAEDESRLVCFLVQKLRPQTTVEDIDAMPAKLVQDLLGHMITMSARVDSPFSLPFTP